MSQTNFPANRLLAALPRIEFNELRSKLEQFELIYDSHIYEPDTKIEHIYFPESGIISLLSQVDDRSSIEVGIVGSEGMAGLPVFLGVKKSGNVAVIQGAGTALRMTTVDFLAATAASRKFTAIIQRFIHSLFVQVSQSAACNRFHPIEERLARWLLMTGDRMHSSEFQITQEFLSNMLGVRREAVNKAAGSLNHKELISYSRGELKINDRKGLENAACPCYWIIRNEYDYESH